MLFYGCTQCSYRDDSIDSVQCDMCDFGYYLLTVAVDPEDDDTGGDAGRLSMCVQDCSAFAYNYVNNEETGKCEYCGATCTHCSSKQGCLVDYMFDRGYKNVTAEEYYPTGEGFFSDEAPSTAFRTS